jgi:hypothetical protein
MRKSFKLAGLPLYLIRLETGRPFVLGGTSPDGHRFKFLPLFDTEETAEAFRAVATAGKEHVAALATWDEVIEAVHAVRCVGCDRVAWNPGSLRVKELEHTGIAALLHLAQTSAEPN